MLQSKWPPRQARRACKATPLHLMPCRRIVYGQRAPLSTLRVQVDVDLRKGEHCAVMKGLEPGKTCPRRWRGGGGAGAALWGMPRPRRVLQVVPGVFYGGLVCWRNHESIKRGTEIHKREAEISISLFVSDRGRKRETGRGGRYNSWISYADSGFRVPARGLIHVLCVAILVLERGIHHKEVIKLVWRNRRGLCTTGCAVFQSAAAAFELLGSAAGLLATLCESVQYSQSAERWRGCRR